MPLQCSSRKSRSVARWRSRRVSLCGEAAFQRYVTEKLHADFFKGDPVGSSGFFLSENIAALKVALSWTRRRPLA